MDDSKRQILQMLSEGKINIDEAERLLNVLESESGAPEPSPASDGAENGKKPKFLIIKVHDPSKQHHGHENVNIKIPMVLLKAGIKLSTLMPDRAYEKINSHFQERGMHFDLNNLTPEKLEGIMEALKESAIEIDGDDKKIQIFCS
ncbi:MAG TPA: hypothetical protein DEO84_11230 [candidate division Zixibacteria bacterium]|jgi:hypothetical protein|nr:hypothetical protein [candidate division Zixibacteria bacterium]